MNYQMSKRTYRSKAEAKREAIRLMSSQGNQRKGGQWIKGTKLHPFKCQHGDHWHLSSREPRS
jgi:hypothetical protein